jgi:hypothetical protein
MDKQQDDLLAKELGKVGYLAGKWRGGKAKAIGASLGARFAATFLPTESYQELVNVSADVELVFTKLCSFLLAKGRIASDNEAGTSQFPKISAVIGSGFLSMNPTIVHIEVIDIEKNSCVLLVTGAAKEGLIKQQSAQKAVIQVLEFLKTIN